MIAWCGSQAEGLGWLSARCNSIDEVKLTESISIQSIDAMCTLHPRRLILSVENRLDYPLAEIQHLQRNWPEVPFALAVGSWFDGSRRTGIGATSHLSLPWYRWWDGWQQWLVGSNAKLLNPWPQVNLNCSLVGLVSRPFTTTTGVILSNCRHTAEGWRAGFKVDPDRAHVVTSRAFPIYLSQVVSLTPDWVLWDDTCLDTFAGTDCRSEVVELFRTIRARFPDVVLLAATSMPRWEDWQQWMLAGANELIPKPSQSSLLAEELLR
jgi:hypothetical protein